MKSYVVLCLLLCFSLAGCGGEGEIISPADGAVSPSAPDYQITYTDEIPPNFEVYLNTENVTSFFSVSGNSATAGSGSLLPFLNEGENVLSVRGGRVPSSTFYYDTTGPKVRITSVTDLGSSQRVEGHLYDPAGGVSLSVNGAPVTITQDEFVTTIAKQAINHFVATDAFNQQSDTHFLQENETLQPVMGIRVNQGAGLAKFEDIIGPMLYDRRGSFEDALRDKKLFDENVAIVGSATIYGRTATFDEPRVEVLVNQQGVNWVDIVAEIPNLYITGSGNGCTPFPFCGSRSAWFSSSLVLLTARATINITGNEFDISLSNLNTQFTDFNYDISNTPGALLALVGGSVRPKIREAFDRNFFDVMPSFLEQVLGDFPRTITSTLNLRLGQPTSTLRLDLDPVEMQTSSGGFNLDLLGKVVTTTPNPEISTLGSVYYPSSLPRLPQMPSTTPDGSSYEAGLVIPLNTINQALLAEYSAGALSGSLGSDVSIQAYEGQYLRAEGGGGAGVRADGTSVNEFERFTLIDLGNNQVAFQCHNGNYLVAEGAGGGPVNCNRPAIGPWEIFTLEPRGNGQTAIRCSSGTYLKAELGGGGEVNCTAPTPNQWESFRIKDELGPNLEFITQLKDLTVDGVAAFSDDDRFQIRFDSVSPPEAELLQGDNYLAKVLLNDLTVEVTYLPAGEAQWETILAATVNIELPVNLDINVSNNTLEVSHATPRVILLSVQGGVFDWGEDTTRALIYSAVPSLTPAIVNAVESIELPRYLGYTIDPQQIWTMDFQNKVIAVAGDLVQ